LADLPIAHVKFAAQCDTKYVAYSSLLVYPAKTGYHSKVNLFLLFVDEL